MLERLLFLVLAISSLNCLPVAQKNQDSIFGEQQLLETYGEFLLKSKYLARMQLKDESFYIESISPLLRVDLLTKKFGNPKEIKRRTTKSINGTIEILTYQYDGLHFDVIKDKIFDIYCFSEKFTNPDMMHVGMSLSELQIRFLDLQLKSEEDGIIVFFDNDGKLRFHLLVQSGKIAMMAIRTPN